MCQNVLYHITHFNHYQHYHLIDYKGCLYTQNYVKAYQRSPYAQMAYMYDLVKHWHFDNSAVITVIDPISENFAV